MSLRIKEEENEFDQGSEKSLGPLGIIGPEQSHVSNNFDQIDCGEYFTSTIVGEFITKSEVLELNTVNETEENQNIASFDSAVVLRTEEQGDVRVQDSVNTVSFLDFSNTIELEDEFMAEECSETRDPLDISSNTIQPDQNEPVYAESFFTVINDHDRQKFSCPIIGCSVSFAAQRYLNQHLNVVHAPEEKCPHENCKFRTRPNFMSNHIRLAHKPSPCPICGKEFFSDSIKQHVDECKYEFVCNKCSNVFSTKLALTIHQEKVHKNPTESRSAEEIYESEKTFLLRKTITSADNVDLRIEAFNASQYIINSIMVRVGRYTVDGEDLLYCPIVDCGLPFSCPIKLEDHIDRAHPSRMRCYFKKCKRFVDADNFVNHVASAHCDRTKCPFCTVELDRQFLKAHTKKCGKSRTTSATQDRPGIPHDIVIKDSHFVDVEKIRSEERDSTDCSTDYAVLTKLLDERLRKINAMRFGQLVCPIRHCEKMISISSLKDHLSIHDIDLGKAIFSNIRKLINDVLSYENSNGLFICSYEGCGTVLDSNSTFEKHLNLVHPKPIRCRIQKCKHIIRPEELKNHIKSFHADETKCPRCTMKLTSESLDYHLENCDKKRILSDTEECEIVLLSKSDSSTDVRQSNKPIEIKCPRPNCLTYVDPNVLDQHLEVHYDRAKGTCYHCKRRVHFLNLDMHLTRCSKIRNHKLRCTVKTCRKIFWTSDLISHIDRHHSSILHIECPYEDCSASFRTSEFERHVGMVHDRNNESGK